MGPKSHSNIGSSDGRQCDLAHIHLPGEALKWGPQTPDWGPHFGASPAEFSLVYKGLLHYTSPGGGPKQGSQTPYWGPHFGA